MARFVVEFGKDGTPPPEEGRLDAPAFHRNAEPLWQALSPRLPSEGALLGAGGTLFVYGPFMRDGAHTAPSNAAFDASLRAQNSAWGVRDIRDLDRLAVASGLAPAEIVEMPANNFVLVFARANRT